MLYNSGVRNVTSTSCRYGLCNKMNEAEPTETEALRIEILRYENDKNRRSKLLTRLKK